MTLKQYKTCRLAIIIALSFSISISISLQNYLLPIIFVISAFAGMLVCRKQLKTQAVMADERDYRVAGDAARYAIFIYAWIGVVITFVLMAISNGSGPIYVISQCIAFSVCFIMLLNAFLFKFLIKKDR